MNKELTFRIQSLLYEKDENTISGPMSPFEFAIEVTKNNGDKFNRLARVWFNDDTIFQVYEGYGFTGHDTLIIANQYENDLWLSLWIDKGGGGLPVAMCFQSDMQLVVTPIYKKAKFKRKLSEEQILIVFKHIFETPHEIDIKPLKAKPGKSTNNNV